MKSHGLSSRALQWAAVGYSRGAVNHYHPHTNPLGIIPMGTSDNVRLVFWSFVTPLMVMVVADQGSALRFLEQSGMFPLALDAVTEPALADHIRRGTLFIQ